MVIIHPHRDEDGASALVINTGPLGGAALFRLWLLADGLQQVHGLLFGQNALRRLHGGRQGLKAVLPGAEIPIAGSQKEVGGPG